MLECADRIRNIGNVGAHVGDEVTQAEIEIALLLAEAMLLNFYELPWLLEQFDDATSGADEQPEETTP